MFNYFMVSTWPCRKFLARTKDVGKSLPKPKEIKKAVAKAREESELKAKSRGKYNIYSDTQRAEIGNYGAEQGATNAAKHFCSLWKALINESMSRRLKSA